ncbi:hypothetical protein [Methanoculleus chikugoensis]|uniref:hypothetical protein n=1 Tax=Methanoculleus chikugoensis TaxID=118126 RepID=UPI000AF77E68|nr:hypothetical protein [Methanoculleus chikugoensis]
MTEIMPPIIETLYTIYREQHGRIADAVGQKFPTETAGSGRNARLVRQFAELKKKV